jgi:hypothetical protein
MFVGCGTAIATGRLSTAQLREMGARPLFALWFVILAAIQVIASRRLNRRKTFVIGLSAIFGPSVDVVPDPYRARHPWLQPLVLDGSWCDRVRIPTPR